MKRIHRWAYSLFTISMISLVASLSSIVKSDSHFFHASRWDPTVPQYASNYTKATVWGGPIFYVIDDQLGGKTNSLDIEDEIFFHGAIANLAFWIVVTGSIYGVKHGTTAIYRVLAS